MRIIVWLAALMLASAPAAAQLVKTIHQTFEVPDSTVLISFEIYEKDLFEAVPWAGNTIMTESNIKLYYASRGVFDHFLEKGRYNFESRELGDTLTLAAVNERHLEIKLNTAKPDDKEEGGTRAKGGDIGGKKKSENVNIRIFIPDDFSQTSPTTWARPRKEQSEERIGAYRPRKKLNRESGAVSDELREAIPEQPADTVKEEYVLPLPDSTLQRYRDKQEKPKKD